MKSKIERIAALVPVVYPLIIFLGFYNYIAYYRYFNIEIFHYLNVYELLFSFISLVIPVFLIGFVVFCYFLFIVLFQTSLSNGKKSRLKSSTEKPTSNEEENRKNEKDVNISLIFNNSHSDITDAYKSFVRNKRKKDTSMAIFNFLGIFSGIIGLTIKLALWFFTFFFTSAAFSILIFPLDHDLEYYRPFFSSETSSGISIVIWLFMALAIIHRAGIGKKISAVKIAQAVALVFVLFLSISVYQKIQAEKTTNHQNENISFEYNGKNIMSDSDVVFVGKTSEYIFLRNIQRQINLIFPITDVEDLQLITNRKKGTSNK